MKRIGYLRVSTKDQNLDRQIVAMLREGVEKEHLYMDQFSGHSFDRPQYKRMIKEMKKDDIVIIKSIDRLGRNYDEIIEQWRFITKEKGAFIQVIDMPLLNTTEKHDNLTRTFISDLVLQILAYVAETERAMIKQRQAEGIENALKKGVHFGRPKIQLPDEFEMYCENWRRGEITIREAASALSMNYSTFYRKCKEKIEGKAETSFKK